MTNVMNLEDCPEHMEVDEESEVVARAVPQEEYLVGRMDRQGYVTTVGEEDAAVFWDDASGERLDPIGVRRACEEEVEAQ